MTYLVGQSVLQIKAGAPNNGRGEDNRGMVKQFTAGREVFPYVSAQAARRWLRDSMPSGEPLSPVIRSGEGKKQQAYTKGRPDQFLDDDLFGYMIAVKADDKGAKKGESKTFMRDTVLATGTLVAVVPNRPTMDFGTMSRDFGPGTNPVIHEHEMYTADLAGDLLLDLPRVGTFETGGKTIKAALSPSLAAELLKEVAEEAVLRGVQCVRLPIGERRRRVAVLLRTMAEVKGGAKQSAHYGDRTPGLIILAPVKGGTNPFTRIVRERDRKTYFDVGILREEVEAWEDELDGPVRIGWAPGFLGDQRDRARTDLEDLVKADKLILGHPRTVLGTLAKEFIDGDHDDWFDDGSAL
ncbi:MULTISPECIES: type I-B CRISPR-associated protein Cas7/Cst2/DevR [unclassified Streptomyces]|uniref:type I-B CRISPR-associated protein Cas7/Cst2/DevR n=1 Tax=unclassified Streptomyces TaxID=2593676 RepID=UPI0007ED1204|nr:MULTISPECIES: type I-B CRISPR-associated protein Cas7/Cst2/DevR [unclassified Streptomyces]MCP3771302.1 type I-B CRISPR-associated protein Cas7/Cst2/DevR [Streptomyces sp. MAR25Y5]OBQ52276.1 type I-B CRISPR-associated protein Cas7/Cst2/DevR [Streptomyces sp. H-KF8]